jgi:Spy/CpxP family protein refolding chaperone
MKTKLIAGLVVLALVATAVVAVSARNNLGMQSSMKAHQWSRGPCGMNALTDEESATIQQELQDYRQTLLTQYGITLTEEQIDELRQAMQEQRQEMQQQMQAFRQELFDQYDFPLTDEDRQEIQEQMQEQRQEMQQEMQELFDQYGIDLTDEEREEIRQQMQEYRQELLAEYGISCPNGPLGAGEGGNGLRGRMMGLRLHGFRGGPGFVGGFAPSQDLVE